MSDYTVHNGSLSCTTVSVYIWILTDAISFFYCEFSNSLSVKLIYSCRINVFINKTSWWSRRKRQLRCKLEIMRHTTGEKSILERKSDMAIIYAVPYGMFSQILNRFETIFINSFHVISENSCMLSKMTLRLVVNEMYGIFKLPREYFVTWHSWLPIQFQAEELLSHVPTNYFCQKCLSMPEFARNLSMESSVSSPSPQKIGLKHYTSILKTHIQFCPNS
jgi:hypothetical protein